MNAEKACVAYLDALYKVICVFLSWIQHWISRKFIKIISKQEILEIKIDVSDCSYHWPETEKLAFMSKRCYNLVDFSNKNNFSNSEYASAAALRIYM